MKRAKFLQYFPTHKTLGHSFYLQFWMLVQFVFLNIPLYPLNYFRVWLLRIFGAKIGKNVIIRPFVKIYDPSKLTLKDGVWIGENTWIYNIDDVFVGENSVISQHAIICTASHNYKSKYFETITDPILIKKNAWICLRAIILPGSIIEDKEIVECNKVRKRTSNIVSIHNS